MSPSLTRMHPRGRSLSPRVQRCASHPGRHLGEGGYQHSLCRPLLFSCPTTRFCCAVWLCTFPAAMLDPHLPCFLLQFSLTGTCCLDGMRIAEYQLWHCMWHCMWLVLQVGNFMHFFATFVAGLRGGLLQHLAAVARHAGGHAHDCHLWRDLRSGAHGAHQQGPGGLRTGWQGG